MIPIPDGCVLQSFADMEPQNQGPVQEKNKNPGVLTQRARVEPDAGTGSYM
jgi:hypothetical protein